MLWDTRKSIKMTKVITNKLLTLNVINLNIAILYQTHVSLISEERRQGLRTWILDSFKELHDVQAQRFAVAGIIVEEIRNNIYEETGFRCSAGIAQNKVYNFFIFFIFCYSLHISIICIL